MFKKVIFTVLKVGVEAGAGFAAGYIYAKKKLEKSFEESLKAEKEYYERQLSGQTTVVNDVEIGKDALSTDAPKEDTNKTDESSEDTSEGE